MKILCKNKHWSLNKDYNTDKILYLLIDRPKRINNNQYFYWRDCNENHRNYDLPSYISDSHISWRTNKTYCRKDNKPTIICND